MRAYETVSGFPPTTTHTTHLADKVVLVLMAISDLALMLGSVHTITTVTESAMSNLPLKPGGPCTSMTIPLIHAMFYPLLMISTSPVIFHGMALVVIVLIKRFVDYFFLVKFLEDYNIFLAPIKIVKLIFD